MSTASKCSSSYRRENCRAGAAGPVDDEVERVTLLRPGHADLAGTQKYGFDDVRPILERSSARETAQRVAVGAVARALLAEIGITIHSHALVVGDVEAVWNHPEAQPLVYHDQSFRTLCALG